MTASILRFAIPSVLLLGAGGALPAHGQGSLAPVKAWIAAQKGTDSLAGEFTQVRRLRALRQPLTTPGQFWFEAPDRFRWELGRPPRTVAVHRDNQLIVLDTEKREAQVITTSVDEDSVEAATYFSMSLPRTWDAFLEAFEILKLVRQGQTHFVELKPKQRRMARGVKVMTFEIGPDNETRGFVLELRDGSIMETSFHGVKRNVAVADDRFSVSLDGYEVKRKER